MLSSTPLETPHSGGPHGTSAADQERGPAHQSPHWATLLGLGTLHLAHTISTQKFSQVTYMRRNPSLHNLQ